MDLFAGFWTGGPTMLPFEDLNVEAYRMLSRIEILVRETISREMMTRGPGWQRQLPDNLKKKIRAEQRDEIARRQYGFLRLGPLYYLTYGELIDLCRRNPWADVVTASLGAGVVDLLAALTISRNAVAHCRSVSLSGLATIQAAYDQVTSALTLSEAERYLSTPDIGVFPEDARPLINKWLRTMHTGLSHASAPCGLDPLCTVARQQFWWSDSALAGFSVDSVDQVITLLDEYNRLPCGVGAAAARVRWLEKTNLVALTVVAISATE
jgi:hypothetical protein